MTSHFDRALLPSARTFYEGQFGSALGRERRGWSQTKCCFHDGQSKTSLSLNMAEGGFFCFSCEAKGGSIVDFLMRRDGLDFKTAVQSLGAWLEMTDAVKQEIQRRDREREQKRNEERVHQEQQRARRLAVRDEIHSDTRLINDLSAQLRKQPDSDSLWRSLHIAWESRELSEREYMRLAGLEVGA